LKQAQEGEAVIAVILAMFARPRLSALHGKRLKKVKKTAGFQ
jgi:hypothetical protein